MLRINQLAKELGVANQEVIEACEKLLGPAHPDTAIAISNLAEQAPAGVVQRDGAGRDQLLREAWGWEYLVETKTVDTHVKRLRDKLEAAGVDPALVETVRGYGYRFHVA